MFVVLGKYSYFIYFAHFVLLDLVKNLLKGRSIVLDFAGAQSVFFLLLLTFTLIVSCMFATISFKYFEHPFIARAHKLKSED
jgi:peptidoglycan/LPS O-acetylase OafA/YrhL